MGKAVLARRASVWVSNQFLKRLKQWRWAQWRRHCLKYVIGKKCLPVVGYTSSIGKDIIYVGKSKNLKNRIRQHLSDDTGMWRSAFRRALVKRYNNIRPESTPDWIKRNCVFSYLRVQDPDMCGLVESLLIAYLRNQGQPLLNTQWMSNLLRFKHMHSRVVDLLRWKKKSEGPQRYPWNYQNHIFFPCLYRRNPLHWLSLAM